MDERGRRMLSREGVGVKRLLIFAHKQEASAFLKRGDWRRCEKVPSLYEGVYTKEREVSADYLCITGEGVHAVLHGLTRVLGYLAGEVTSLVNMGLCGSLRAENENEIGQVCEVRMAYDYGHGKPLFQSYGCYRSGLLPSMDCISAMERVGDKTMRYELGHHASLVDREIWAVGYVAEKYALRFSGLKVISDLANDFTVKERPNRSQAEAWSEALYRAYESFVFEEEKGIRKARPQLKKSSWIDALPSKDFFYITAAQQGELEALLSSWLRHKDSFSLRQQLQGDKGFRSIVALKLTRKNRTKSLIRHLKEQLDPDLGKVTAALGALESAFLNRGLQMKCSKGERKKPLKVRFCFEVSSRKELNTMIKVLDEVPIERIEALMQGKPLS